MFLGFYAITTEQGEEEQVIITKDCDKKYEYDMNIFNPWNMEQYIYIIPVSQIPVILTSEYSCVMSQLRLESWRSPSPSLPSPEPQPADKCTL